VNGQATPKGATHPSLTLSGAVRPGDSGGAVLNPRGQLVGVVWGQRDGTTYTTCGRALREFLDRLRGQPFVPKRFPGNPPIASPQSPAPSPDSHARLHDIESRLAALDAKKQDKGDYLRAEALDGYLRASDATSRFRTLGSRFELVQARIESVQKHVEQVAAGNGGLLQGLSFGKLLVGALGLSGPLAAAVIVAGGLSGRRIKSGVESRGSRAGKKLTDDAVRSSGASNPIAVDSPPPPQRTMPETRYVSVEKDSFAKAHQWASEHVARKYPGATEVLQAQDSLIKQYLAAK
jgi:hypothetical protein